jgi:hypothetical protein
VSTDDHPGQWIAREDWLGRAQTWGIDVLIEALTDVHDYVLKLRDDRDGWQTAYVIIEEECKVQRERVKFLERPLGQ